VTSDAGPGPSTGSAAEEANRLFEAVQEWARRSAGEGKDLGEHWTEHIATGGPECRLCPVCQLIGLLRDTRPEVAGHLTDAVGSLLAALRSALLAHEREWTARRPTGVERIDIG
jgi:Family of unknown function (DUF5304)